MATDTLSDLLRTVRLTGAAFFEIAAQEPWAVASPARDDSAENPAGRRSSDRLSCRDRGPLFASSRRKGRSRSKPARSSSSPTAIRISCRAARHARRAADAGRARRRRAGAMPFRINLGSGPAGQSRLRLSRLRCAAVQSAAGEPAAGDQGGRSAQERDGLARPVHPLCGGRGRGQTRRRRERPHQAERADVHRGRAPLSRGSAGGASRLARGSPRPGDRQGIVADACAAGA